MAAMAELLENPAEKTTTRQPKSSLPDAVSGGEVLVRQLLVQGVDTVFCVPGESYLAVLDALHDAPISLVTCRHEGAATMMAEATGKLGGRPGVAMVTRGPGATNASAGVHVAQQDSTPLILFVGQIARGDAGRDAFQEVDYLALFGGMAKWVVEVSEARRLPEIISRAWHVAMAGRPGPVVVALPEDMLTDTVVVDDAPRVVPGDATPSSAAVEQILQRLGAAHDPLLVVGGSRWTAAACTQLIDFAERYALPVATAFRRQMLFPADHPQFVGDLGLAANPSLVSLLSRSDALLALGTRLGDITTQGYLALPVPGSGESLMHVYPEASDIGRVYAPAMSAVCTPEAFLTAALRHDRVPGKAVRPSLNEARQRFLAWSTPPSTGPGDVHMGGIIQHLASVLPSNAIITNGAGNYATWVHRYFPFRAFNTQVAPVSGSMGYGLPAAVAAKLMFPERVVVAFAGDGCFMMTCQELATAVQYGVAVIVVVVDNNMLGTIRMHQERHYPGRVVGTTLGQTDFAGLARALGAHGERLQTTADFAPAFQRARESRLPALIHCPIDPQAITPTATLSELISA